MPWTCWSIIEVTTTLAITRGQDAGSNLTRAVDVARLRPGRYSRAMTTLKVELPEQLREQLRALVAQGWFASEDALIQEAVRRFLEARAPELGERFAREDVDWGLKGDD